MALAKQGKTSFSHTVLWCFALAAGIYLSFSLIISQVNISSKRQTLAAVQTELSEQLQQNEELERELSGSDDSIVERVARDELGYAKPNERVFVDTSGR